MKVLIILLLVFTCSCVQKPKKSFKKGTGDHLEPLREQSSGGISPEKNVFIKMTQTL